MSIREFRLITIQNKIITKDDVQKLANALYSIYERRKEDSDGELKFKVLCFEGAGFTSAYPDIFSDDSPVNSKRPFEIDMSLKIERQEIEIKLVHWELP